MSKQREFWSLIPKQDYSFSIEFINLVENMPKEDFDYLFNYGASKMPVRQCYIDWEGYKEKGYSSFKEESLRLQVLLKQEMLKTAAEERQKSIKKSVENKPQHTLESFFERAGLKGNGKPKDLYTKTGSSKEEWLKKILAKTCGCKIDCFCGIAKTSTIQQRLIDNIDFDKYGLNKLYLDKKLNAWFDNPEEKNKLTLDQTKCYWNICFESHEDRIGNITIFQIPLFDITEDHTQLINYVVDKKFGEMLVVAAQAHLKEKYSLLPRKILQIKKNSNQNLIVEDPEKFISDLDKAIDTNCDLSQINKSETVGQQFEKTKQEASIKEKWLGGILSLTCDCRKNGIMCLVGCDLDPDIVQQRLIDSIDISKYILLDEDCSNEIITAVFKNEDNFWRLWVHSFIPTTFVKVPLADITRGFQKLNEYVTNKEFGDKFITAVKRYCEEKFKVKGQDMKYKTPEEQELANSKPRKKVEDSPIFKRADEKREFEASKEAWLQTPEDLDKYNKCLQFAEDLVLFGKLTKEDKIKQVKEMMTWPTEVFNASKSKVYLELKQEIFEDFRKAKASKYREPSDYQDGCIGELIKSNGLDYVKKLLKESLPQKVQELNEQLEKHPEEFKDIKQDPPAKVDDLLKFVEEKIKLPGTNKKDECFSCGYKPGDELNHSDKVKRSEKDKEQEMQEISEEKERFKSESKKLVENYYGEEEQLSSKDKEKVENLFIEEPTNPNHASYKDVDKYLSHKDKPFKKITPSLSKEKDKPKEIDYKKAYYNLLDKIDYLHKESCVFENSLLKENINKELSKEIEGKQESYNQFKESLALKHRCLSVIADYDKEHRIHCVDGFYSLTGLKAKIEDDKKWVIRDLENKIVVILSIDDLLKHTGQSSLLFEKEFGEAFVDFIHTREAQKRSKLNKKEELKKFLNQDGSLNDPLDSVDRLSDNDIKDVIKKIEDTKARNKLYGKKNGIQDFDDDFSITSRYYNKD